MRFNVEILFTGFSGKLAVGYHGWGTWALIRDGKHTIMLDTGYVGLRKDYHEILAERGVSCEEVDYVLLTHMHFDHACNVDLFPNAVFVLSKEEWEYANDVKRRDLFIERSAIPVLEQAEKISDRKGWAGGTSGNYGNADTGTYTGLLFLYPSSGEWGTLGIGPAMLRRIGESWQRERFRCP